MRDETRVALDDYQEAYENFCSTVVAVTDTAQRMKALSSQDAVGAVDEAMLMLRLTTALVASSRTMREAMYDYKQSKAAEIACEASDAGYSEKPARFWKVGS